MRKSIASSVFVLALLISCAAAYAHSWPLLAEVSVAGESIYLSDLLPAQIPADIRVPAERIRVGQAPAPGVTITLSAERITSSLPQVTRDEITIPSQVVVHRSGRLLTRAEVVAALHSALQSNRLPGASGIESDDVHFSVPVLVTTADPLLEVRRVDFDPALKQARFVLASRADRRSLPFIVTADLRSTSDETGSGSNAASTSVGPAGVALVSTKLSSDEIPLVQPRKLAQLHVVSGSMQMLLDVLPLEKGGLHQTVRVRIPASGRILRGQVIAPGRLEAQF